MGFWESVIKAKSKKCRDANIVVNKGDLDTSLYILDELKKSRQIIYSKDSFVVMDSKGQIVVAIQFKCMTDNNDYFYEEKFENAAMRAQVDSNGETVALSMFEGTSFHPDSILTVFSITLKNIK